MDLRQGSLKDNKLKIRHHTVGKYCAYYLIFYQDNCVEINLKDYDHSEYFDGENRFSLEHLTELERKHCRKPLSRRTMELDHIIPPVEDLQHPHDFYQDEHFPRLGTKTNAGDSFAGKQCSSKLKGPRTHVSKGNKTSRDNESRMRRTSGYCAYDLIISEDNCRVVNFKNGNGLKKKSSLTLQPQSVKNFNSRDYYQTMHHLGTQASENNNLVYNHVPNKLDGSTTNVRKSSEKTSEDKYRIGHTEKYCAYDLVIGEDNCTVLNYKNQNDSKKNPVTHQPQISHCHQGFHPECTQSTDSLPSKYSEFTQSTDSLPSKYFGGDGRNFCLEDYLLELKRIKSRKPSTKRMMEFLDNSQQVKDFDMNDYCRKINFPP
ncbi:hypothetical protein JTE90_026956 [Oedothorax gibbosus]|uniref:Uncharacterized protein n=1 Tax=Oedothorax gibbosus TaxID=931172 RepID=A0AAV6UVX0_9ARAC|nr:hypothetical protein JTE90_026956 [Oedothorax gibbosus]